jgi:OmpA-OmpF porin, OOP family
MSKESNPPSTCRAGALAIAAAFTAFTGVAAAQPSGDKPGLPGYVVSSDGRPVLSGFGNCVRSSFWATGDSVDPCDRIPVAQVPAPPPVAAAPAVQPAPPPAPAPIVVAPPRPVIQKLTLSTDVLFDFGKAELKDSGKARLDQLAAEIKDANVDEIIAVGHADRIASEEYNQKLSEQRAEAVKDYLSQQGAKAKTITAEGKGKSQPVTGDDCKKMGAERAANKKLVACLQPDRRVEIEVLGSREVAAGAPASAGAGTTGTPGAAGGGATTR